MLFESGSTPAGRTVVNPERQRNEETKKKGPKAAFDSDPIIRPSAAERETENANWAAETRKERDLLGEIGIGGCLAAPVLPHHRAYGSVPRRFGWLNFGFRLFQKQWDAQFRQYPAR